MREARRNPSLRLWPDSSVLSRIDGRCIRGRAVENSGIGLQRRHGPRAGRREQEYKHHLLHGSPPTAMTKLPVWSAMDEIATPPEMGALWYQGMEMGAPNGCVGSERLATAIRCCHGLAVARKNAITWTSESTESPTSKARTAFPAPGRGVRSTRGVIAWGRSTV